MVMASMACFFTLTAGQNISVIFFNGFAWEFGIEKWRGLFLTFKWSAFPRKNARKLSKTSGKSQAKFEVKFGKKTSINLGSGTLLTSCF